MKKQKLINQNKKTMQFNQIKKNKKNKKNNNQENNCKSYSKQNGKSCLRFINMDMISFIMINNWLKILKIKEIN